MYSTGKQYVNVCVPDIFALNVIYQAHLYKQATVHPNEDGFVQLSGTRIALGLAGIELTCRIERYIFEHKCWKLFPSSLPIGPVDTPGYPVLIRERGLTEPLDDCEEMLVFLSIQYNDARKGKHHA